MEQSQASRNRLRLLLPIVGVVALVVVGWQYLQSSTDSTTLTLSGTIEATEIHLASQMGGRVKEVHINEGDQVQSGEDLLDLYAASGGGMNEVITSPINGTVLERLIEPGEIAAPGGTLLVVADLNGLTLTVYVPEDQYGKISLGQTYPVSVDSFPGETFGGKVIHIADQAEFTPRNVQTVEGRKTTVFAIKLDLAGSGGKLKPGMPADVSFQVQ